MRTQTLLLTALMLGHSAAAQELTLFEQTEADPQAQAQLQAQQPAGAVNQNGQPAFTLRGTSRFGDEYRTVLVNRSGEIANISWREGERAEVPGYAGFQVLAVGSKTVTLIHPGEDACIDAEASGVTCAEGNVAMLSLSNAVPLQTNGTVPPLVPNNVPGTGNVGSNTAGQPAVLTNENGQQVFINPFSGEPEVVADLTEEQRNARDERQRARAARLSQIEAVRINDADIPAGMRRVRTPFGDTLAPVRE